MRRRGVSSARRLRRGFTLVELVVYLSLITVGMLLVGAVEMTAKRSVDQQRALIDVQLQGDAFLGRLRRDVEAARKVSTESGVPHTVIALTLGDGTLVRWGIQREELPRGGTIDRGFREETVSGGQPRLETFPAVIAWTPRVERDVGRARLTVEVKLEAGAREYKVTRKRSRTALTRLEVSE